MYYANFYVGLVATAIVPIYFWLTYKQAQKLGGWRRSLRDGREKRAKGFSVSSIQLQSSNPLTGNQLNQTSS